MRVILHQHNADRAKNMLTDSFISPDGVYHHYNGTNIPKHRVSSMKRIVEDIGDSPGGGTIYEMIPGSFNVWSGKKRYLVTDDVAEAIIDMLG